MRRLKVVLAVAPWVFVSNVACSGNSSLGSDQASLSENDRMAADSGSQADDRQTDDKQTDGSDPSTGPAPPGTPGEEPPAPPNDGSDVVDSSTGAPTEPDRENSDDQTEPDTGTPSEPTDCEQIQCFRSIECVETCGGPVVQSGCCECPAGTFDSIECDQATLDDLNTPCAEEGEPCKAGLTPIKYYGIAGENGPEFCSCSIACTDDDPLAPCPEGSECMTIADGPGQVCVKSDP